MPVEIKIGDCLEVLRNMPDKSVHCCVTSPPYFGLRDYGTATWEGGDLSCSHEPPESWLQKNFTDSCGLNIGVDTQKSAAKKRWYLENGDCRCGARRIDRQIGLEQTPKEYVAKLVEVFADVHRVLRDDGTLWLNLGDSYAGSWGAQSRPNGNDVKSTLQGGSMLSARQIMSHPQKTKTGSIKNTPGLKPKDLIGIPWMVAFALRDWGWYLRQDLIWAKNNPMPESVTDRCTKSHEYIFLLSKSERYYFGQEAIKEKAKHGWRGSEFHDGKNIIVHPNTGKNRKQKKPSGWDTSKGSHGNFHKDGRSQETEYTDLKNGTRNKRSVWTVNPKPYKKAHFATFPPDLIRPCILAGCPEGGTVLDPFGGSGTTGQVCIEEGRNAILIELNPNYKKLIDQRLENARTLSPLFSGAE